jgi:hypothetical protein
MERYYIVGRDAYLNTSFVILRIQNIIIRFLLEDHLFIAMCNTMFTENPSLTLVRHSDTDGNLAF